MAVLITMFFALFGLVKMSGSPIYYVATPNGESTSTVDVPKKGKLLVNLWGAGGAGGAYKKQGKGFAGGGGAFVSCYLDVNHGDKVQFRIGQGGRASGFGQDTENSGDASAGMSLIFQFIN